MPRETLVQASVPTLNGTVPSLWVDTGTPQPMLSPSIPVFASTAARDSTWTTPYNGAMCVTTDTYAVWIYQSGAWQRQGVWTVGYQYGTTDVSVYPSAGPITQVNFTAVTGHRYLVQAENYYGVASGTGGLAQYLRLDGTTDVMTRNINWGSAGSSTQYQVQIAVLWVASGLSAGAHSFAILASTSASGLWWQDGTLVITDMGQ